MSLPLVSYLGPAGTHAEEAARAYCGPHAELVAAASTDEALSWAERGTADAVLLPIENSLEGAANRTLDLLRTTSLHLAGEITLPIRHQLLSRAAQAHEVLMILAHPQVLAQCRGWLSRHLPQATQQPTASTAEAARLAAQNTTLAAIAGPAAAQTYDLPVLAGTIADQPHNTTRYVLLSPAASRPTGHDVTSIVCVAPDRASGLLELLAVLANHAVHAHRLQSRPIPERPWRYRFYIDIDGHRHDPPVAGVLNALHERQMLVKVLGSYAKSTSSYS